MLPCCRIERAAVLAVSSVLPCCRIERACRAAVSSVRLRLSACTLGGDFAVGPPWRHTRRPQLTVDALATHSTPSAHARRPGGTLDAPSSQSTPWR
ncbi:hypothetical protein PJP07_28770, partial [Mycobacterium kansasii]